MRVLGIDPGSRVCGWGIVDESSGAQAILHVDNGLFAPSKNKPLIDRLAAIYRGLSDVIEKYKPDEVAVENLFYAKNVKSALVLGHARGVTLLAAQHAGLPVEEYTPTQIKQAVAGYGHATKDQVARMVQAILELPEQAAQDASDALACAICHCNSYRMKRAMKEK